MAELQRDTQRDTASAGLLPKWPKLAGVGQVEDKSLGFYLVSPLGYMGHLSRSTQMHERVACQEVEQLTGTQ